MSFVEDQLLQIPWLLGQHYSQIHQDHSGSGTESTQPKTSRPFRQWHGEYSTKDIKTIQAVARRVLNQRRQDHSGSGTESTQPKTSRPFRQWHGEHSTKYIKTRKAMARRVLNERHRDQEGNGTESTHPKT